MIYEKIKFITHEFSCYDYRDLIRITPKMAAICYELYRGLL